MNIDQRHLYTATMVLDSICGKHRLSTMHVHMPRIILAEFNTHRALSRNTRSTRAVPTLRLIQEVREQPYVPLKWLKNQPGMQGGDPMDEDEHELALSCWLSGANFAAEASERLFSVGLHKQWAGRPLEPYMWVDTLVSSTTWANFMALRDHGDAQPEMELIAQRIQTCLNDSEPRELKPGEWHLPYIRDQDWEPIRQQVNENFGYPIHYVKTNIMIQYAAQVSAARCARISYRPFDGNDTIAAELERFDRLVTQQPVHASPTEHQARADKLEQGVWRSPQEHRNFVGWCQHRAMIPNDTVG